MTKVIILGEAQGAEPKKKIEFVNRIGELGLAPVGNNPHEWGNIELVSRENTDFGGLDVMFAYEDTRSFGCLYIGHFNEGIV